MTDPQQMPLPFPVSDNNSNGIYSGREIGTFKDSMRAPVFRWFRYPAGYSYKFVYESFEIFGVKSDDWVYDPFSGTGTTLICAKRGGINGYGVEAHTFIHWVADVKLYWEFDYNTLIHNVHLFLANLNQYLEDNKNKTALANIYPDLIYRCFHSTDLNELHLIRLFVEAWDTDKHFQNLLKLALTDTLRGAAVAGTGWPYISPRNNPDSYPPRNALNVFIQTLNRMVQDLGKFTGSGKNTVIINHSGDSRQQQNLEPQTVKLAITSPPYLNNYDYADRTRLETYFWGITSSWSEITKKYRNNLLVAATTQIRRSDHRVETALNHELEKISPVAYETLQKAILELAKRRLEKSGKKDYDLMTALYFNGITDVLQETYRLLQIGGHFCLVMGDSAPYGVHIATDDLIGEIAKGIGFSEYHYHQLRTRGKKWKDNPQRHKVPLREGIVILKK